MGAVGLGSGAHGPRPCPAHHPPPGAPAFPCEGAWGEDSVSVLAPALGCGRHAVSDAPRWL